MSKKAQPKIPELVESLLKEMEVFKGEMREGNKSLEDSISKSKILSIFDFERFEETKKSFQDVITHSLKKFETYFQ